MSQKTGSEMFMRWVLGQRARNADWRLRFLSNRRRADLCFVAHVFRNRQWQADPAELQHINAACDRLAGAVIPFRQEYSAMSARLAHLEQVYQWEWNTQQNLLQEGQRMEIPGNESRNLWHSTKELLSGLTIERATDSSDAKTDRMYSSTTRQLNRMGKNAQRRR